MGVLNDSVGPVAKLRSVLRHWLNYLKCVSKVNGRDGRVEKSVPQGGILKGHPQVLAILGEGNSSVFLSLD